jgi:hypothetical protein
MDKTIRRVTDLDEQEAEAYRYWQSQPVGDRLVAVCELSEAAYAFAADFKGALILRGNVHFILNYQLADHAPAISH